MPAHRVVPDHETLRKIAGRDDVKSFAALARNVGIGPSTLYNHLEGKGLIPEFKALLKGEEYEGDEMKVESQSVPKKTREADPESDEVKAFLKRRGVNLKEWVPVSAQVREYPQVIETGVVQDMEYIRVDCKPIAGAMVLQVAPAPTVRKVRPVKPRGGEPEVTVLMSCHQAPYHDERAHEIVCGFLAMLEPHRWTHLGDLLDYATVSKYKHNPDYAAGLRETHVVSHRLLAEMRDASPNSLATLKPGNHDYRLPDFIRSGVSKELADLAPVGESDPWWHPRRMLHLDALGIEYIDAADGMWERARLNLAPTLTALHGWRTGKAVAARDTARELGVSVICGHTHRQAVTPVTVGRDGMDHLLYAMEVGCLCRTDGGLGYVPGIADWQQGVGVASVWPDGQFHLELAQIVDGAIRFRGQRLGPRQLKVAA